MDMVNPLCLAVVRCRGVFVLQVLQSGGVYTVLRNLSCSRMWGAPRQTAKASLV